MGRERKAEQLTEAEKKKLLADYDALPIGPRGKKLQGSVKELAYQWRVSRQWLSELIHRRDLTEQGRL